MQQHRVVVRRRLVPALVAALILGAPSAPARAGNPGSDIVVSTFEDEILVDGDCSLREAVIAANTDVPVDACTVGGAHDLVLLPAGTYALTIPGAGEDASLTGDLDITSRVSIATLDFGRQGVATIDGGGIDRIFDIHAIANVSSIEWLVMTNGDAGVGEGGAIRVADSTCEAGVGHFIDLGILLVEGNRARVGGGIHIGACRDPVIRFTSIIGNVAAENGGGVSVVGNTSGFFETSTFSGNQAGVAGGAIWSGLDDLATTSLELATLADNTAPEGAGVWVQSGRVSAESTIIAANHGPNCGPFGAPPVYGLADDDTCSGAGFDGVGLLPLTRVGMQAVHPLADDSRAIDIGGVPFRGNGWCGTQSRDDQLGTVRPLDGDGDGIAGCDYGAVEHPAVPLVEPPPSPGPSEPPPVPVVPNTAVPAPSNR